MTIRSEGQLALDLPFRPALGAGDFLIASGNREAVAFIDRWPEWEAPGLVIHGPPGCGKSHLLEVWRARSNATLVDAAEASGTEPSELLGAGGDLAVERIDAVADETLLFHLYNLVVERRGKMLLTARTAPAHLTWRLPDLASRIGGLPAVALAEPDDTLLAAVLVKLFADRQIEAEAAVIAYLIARMERSFEATHRLVAALDRRALEMRRPITVPLARYVLNTEFDFDDDPGGT